MNKPRLSTDLPERPRLLRTREELFDFAVGIARVGARAQLDGLQVHLGHVIEHAFERPILV